MRPFLFLFLGIVFSSYGAAVKLVLVGVPEYVALATAGLSGDTGIELIERSAISQILQEHGLSETKLSGTELCKFFPHTDIFAVIDAKSMRTFNAKNGFLLTDIGHDGSVQKIVSGIRLATDKTLLRNPLLLGKLTYRDIGVPRRLKNQLPEAVLDIERLLLADRRIQLLERERLDMVSGERTLSGVAFQLPASMLLMSLEFEPGEDSGVVNLLIQVRDLEQQKVADQTIRDIFNRPSNIRQGVEALRKKLIEVTGQKRGLQ
jgi:hypothetical protein